MSRDEREPSCCLFDTDSELHYSSGFSPDVVTEILLLGSYVLGFL